MRRTTLKRPLGVAAGLLATWLTVSLQGCATAGVRSEPLPPPPSRMTPGPIEPGDPGSLTVVYQTQPPPHDANLRFRGHDFAAPEIVALHGLVEDILADYGHPESDLDRSRVIRDWVARTAIHPHPPFHMDGTLRNSEVLPEGGTWDEANRAAKRGNKLATDSQFWDGFAADGYRMLDSLLGTLDPATGQRAEDGMMEHVRGSWYRIRDIDDYKYVLCSYQDSILTSLWAAAGLHGMLVSTVGHDPAAVFIPDLRKWVYSDPTYNEEYVIDGSDGVPLSPVELLDLTLSGRLTAVVPRTTAGPRWSPEAYITVRDHPQATYLGPEHPGGWGFMGSKLNNAPGPYGTMEKAGLVHVDFPGMADLPYFDSNTVRPRVSRQVAFPDLGVHVESVSRSDSGYRIVLESGYPFHVRFERRIDGADWETVSAEDRLDFGNYVAEYRSIDRAGRPSMTTVVSVRRPE